MPGEEIFYLPVTELAKRIESKTLSPVELTETCLDRSQKLGPRFNAFARLTPEIALAQAKAAEKEIRRGHYRGPLHGIPYAAKDLLSVKGIPTTWGAKPYANQVFDYDATVIEHLNSVGAVMIGKASMIELAGGMGYRFASASLQGEAKNPWDTTCWTCGSSSGSGAIVAAGLAAFAIGTETWGSIVCPSAYCGVSGLRPTFGRVGRGGAMALSYSMDKIGPLARSAADCAIVLQEISGHDSNDTGSLQDNEAFFSYARPQHPLRIGVLTNAWKDVTPDIAKITSDAIAVLRSAGAFVAEAALPEGPWEAAAGVAISVEGASAFDTLIESGRVAELTDPLGKIGGYINQTVPGSDYERALRIRTVIQRKIDDLFTRFDVLAAASLPIAATPMSTNLETDLAFADPLGGIGNFCGLPALSVPSGFTSKNLPAGIQFVGRALDDDAVVAAAELFQSKTNWHRRHPQL